MSLQVKLHSSVRNNHSTNFQSATTKSLIPKSLFKPIKLAGKGFAESYGTLDLLFLTPMNIYLLTKTTMEDDSTTPQEKKAIILSRYFEALLSTYVYWIATLAGKHFITEKILKKHADRLFGGHTDQKQMVEGLSNVVAMTTGLVVNDIIKPIFNAKILSKLLVEYRDKPFTGTWFYPIMWALGYREPEADTDSYDTQNNPDNTTPSVEDISPLWTTPPTISPVWTTPVTAKGLTTSSTV